MGLVSIALGGLAIWLALYLYNQAKNTEQRVGETLAAIKAQTDALQRLTGKMLDRLTTAVTAARPADEALVLLMSTFRDLPTTIAANLRAPSTDAPQQALVNEVLTAYIATFYYTALTNVVSQS